MQVSSITNSYPNKNYNSIFKGHWETREVSCPYPHEELTTTLYRYVADPDETIPEIADNFAKKSGTRNFLNREYYGTDVYTTNANYYTDLSKSREVKKLRLTESANENIAKGNFVEAVVDKINIANILKKQNKERDKFLTEEGIRHIYKLADQNARSLIQKIVNIYNPDMASDLSKILK